MGTVSVAQADAQGGPHPDLGFGSRCHSDRLTSQDTIMLEQ